MKFAFPSCDNDVMNNLKFMIGWRKAKAGKRRCRAAVQDLAEFPSARKFPGHNWSRQRLGLRNGGSAFQRRVRLAEEAWLPAWRVRGCPNMVQFPSPSHHERPVIPRCPAVVPLLSRFVGEKFSVVGGRFAEKHKFCQTNPSFPNRFNPNTLPAIFERCVSIHDPYPAWSATFRSLQWKNEPEKIFMPFDRRKLKRRERRAPRMASRIFCASPFLPGGHHSFTQVLSHPRQTGVHLNTVLKMCAFAIFSPLLRRRRGRRQVSRCALVRPGHFDPRSRSELEAEGGILIAASERARTLKPRFFLPAR